MPNRRPHGHRSPGKSRSRGNIRVGLFADPRSISGLQAWWDFSNVSTLFTDTARTTPVTADGEAIKGVTDLSGNANHLSEATNGPTYKVNIVNGKSVARCDGSNDRLQAATNITDTTISIAFVAVRNASVPFGGLFNTNKHVVYQQGAAVDQWCMYQSLELLSGSALTAFKACIGVARASTDVDLVTNGTLVNNGGGSGTRNSATTVVAGVDGTFFSGDIAEILVYNSAFAAANDNNIGTYLANKYGLTWVKL